MTDGPYRMDANVLTVEPSVETNNGDASTSTPESGDLFSNVYFYKDDQQLGPYSLDKIRTLLREGIILAGDLAWVDGCKSYMAIENVAGLMVESV
jgi:hypothetical protein